MRRDSGFPGIAAMMAAALAAILLFATEVEPTEAPDDDILGLGGATNAFALDLYRHLVEAEEDENLFISPASIHTALAMTYAGARGATAEEMREVLRFDLDDDALHPAMGKMMRALADEGEGCELSVANALWGQKGYRFAEAFLDLTRKHYGAGLREVDFVAAAEQARQAINRWVEERTKDRIKDLIQRGVLTRDTRLVLTNAIYFKGTWKLQFDSDDTRERPFHVTPAKTKRAMMMQLRDVRFRYLDGDGFQALEMPYSGDRVSMVVFLPRERVGLERFEKRLTVDALEEWLSRMVERKIDRVLVPRFTMTRTYGLNETLAEMGMPRAFNPAAADYSGMTGKPDLFISAVVHKAFVEVNEEGTEAAAATGVVMSVTSVAEPTQFLADRPFLFLIRDDRTGAILFMGRVMDPAV